MKTLRKPGRLALIGSLVVALAGAWSGATFAAFTSPVGNPGNVVTAAPDWTAPAINGGGVGTTNGPLGWVNDGNTVAMYLDVTETGNPASGVATVTASANVPGYGALTFQMSAGSWNVRGQQYNYRSDPVAIPVGFPAQVLTVNAAVTDNAGNSTSQNFTLTVDNTAPTATNVQSANGGATQSRMEANDTLTLMASEPLDSWSILSGWNGGAQAMTVRLNDGGVGNDTLTFYNAANNAQLPLGTVNLARQDYTSANRTFASSMAQSGSTITITLGNPSGGVTTAGGTGSMVWNPLAAVTDRAGNAMSTAPRTEPGLADRDF